MCAHTGVTSRDRHRERTRGCTAFPSLRREIQSRPGRPADVRSPPDPRGAGNPNRGPLDPRGPVALSSTTSPFLPSSHSPPHSPTSPTPAADTGAIFCVPVPQHNPARRSRATNIRRLRGRRPAARPSASPAASGPQEPRAGEATQSSPSGCDSVSRSKTATELPASTELPAPHPAPPFIAVGGTALTDPSAERPRRDYFSQLLLPLPGEKAVPPSHLRGPLQWSTIETGRQGRVWREGAAVLGVLAEGSARLLSAASADVAGARPTGRGGAAGGAKSRRGASRAPGAGSAPTPPPLSANGPRRRRGPPPT